MKSAIKLVIKSVLLAILCNCGTVSASEFKAELLRQAAKTNGYKLPSDVNESFDIRKSRLGKLFFDSKELSFNASISCSSCHLNEFSSTDGLPIAIGIGGHGKGAARVKGGGAIIPRNVLPMWGRGAKGFKNFFWDGKVKQEGNGRVTSQFGQSNENLDAITTAILLPFVEIREMVSDDEFVRRNLITESVESANKIQDELIKRIRFNMGKGLELALAFNVAEEDLNFSHAAMSIKHFFNDEFRLKDSRFSRFFKKEISLSSEEIDGGLLFYGKGQCATCHGGPHFSDFDFHTIVMPQFGFGKNGFGIDYGRFNVTFDVNDLYKFRTPPLHNVTKTGPYSHSGSVSDLSSIIEMHYDPLKFLNPDKLNPVERRELFSIISSIDKNQPLGSPLTAEELRKLILFLQLLSF